MTRPVLQMVFVAAVLCGELAPAQACRCAQRTPGQYFAGAEQVFLARAGASRKVDDGYSQTFTVQLVLKGAPGKTFVWRRSEAHPLCGPEHQAGAYALLFVNRGDLDLCAGNLGLDQQIADFPAYRKAARQKTGAISLPALQFSLAAALKGYLHKRASVPVHCPPLAGKRIAIEKTSLPIEGAPGQRAGRKKGVRVAQAFSSGSFSYVAGHYPTEGLNFQVLIRKDDRKGFEVLHLRRAEQ